MEQKLVKLNGKNPEKQSKKKLSEKEYAELHDLFLSHFAEIMDFNEDFYKEVLKKDPDVCNHCKEEIERLFYLYNRSECLLP